VGLVSKAERIVGVPAGPTRLDSLSAKGEPSELLALFGLQAEMLDR
jgi:hypothetical protein